MKLNVQVLGSAKLAKKLNLEKWRSNLRTELTIQAINLQTHIVRDKLSGQVLKNRTGTLRRSINWRIEDQENGPVAFVGSFAGFVSPSGAPAASYARIHEFGATVTVPAHTRTVNGREQSVKEYTAHYPERSFLRSALKDNTEKIRKGIKAATIQAMK